MQPHLLSTIGARLMIGVPAIPDGFDDHSISVCTVKGIHMFLTYQEALEY